MEEPPNKQNKTAWSGLVFFLAGTLAGIVLTTSTGIFGALYNGLSRWSAVQMGKLLDTDFIYLRSGDILQGCIISQDDQTLWLQVPKGAIKIDRRDIRSIEKNRYTRYMQGLW
jgi:hypothetical protein